MRVGVVPGGIHQLYSSTGYNFFFDLFPPDGQDSTGQNKRSWKPYIFSLKEKETYHFLGLDIAIYKSLHHHGGVLWPGVSYST